MNWTQSFGSASNRLTCVVSSCEAPGSIMPSTFNLAGVFAQPINIHPLLRTLIRRAADGENDELCCSVAAGGELCVSAYG